MARNKSTLRNAPPRRVRQSGRVQIAAVVHPIVRRLKAWSLAAPSALPSSRRASPARRLLQHYRHGRVLQKRLIVVRIELMTELVSLLASALAPKFLVL